MAKFRLYSNPEAEQVAEGSLHPETKMPFQSRDAPPTRAAHVRPSKWTQVGNHRRRVRLHCSSISNDSRLERGSAHSPRRPFAQLCANRALWRHSSKPVERAGGAKHHRLNAQLTPSILTMTVVTRRRRRRGRDQEAAKPEGWVPIICVGRLNATGSSSIWG